MDAHTYIGTDPDGSPVALSLPERLRHVAIFGATGVGKSTWLRHIVQQDIDRGEGVLFIDPHGDDAESLIDNVPAHRGNQVCYFDLTDRDFPIGFNVLEDVAPDDRATLAENIVSAMRGIWRESWGNRMERLLRHCAAALIETPNASLVLLPRLLTDAEFRKRIASAIPSRVRSSSSNTTSGATTSEMKSLSRSSTTSKPSPFPLPSATSSVRAARPCISSRPCREAASSS